MLDDRFATVTSVWIVIIPMLVSIYIASLLIVAVFVNVIDNMAFAHVASSSRELYIYCAIFTAFMFSSFCVSVSTYIAIPVYKKIFMVIVFFIPIVWPNIILLFLFGIKNTSYKISGIDTELILFISGSILGGFIAYKLVSKIEDSLTSKPNI